MPRQKQKKEEQLEIKQDIVELQKFYLNAEISNLNEVLITRKDNIVNEIVKFKEEYMSKLGEKETINTYLVSLYFFRSINPLGNISPDYSSEKLSIIFDYYMYLVERVNIEITPFCPNLTHFCKFAGITVNKLKGYRASIDPELREITEKIFDECYNSNLTLSQNRRLSEKSTIYRMRSENEVIEKSTPTVNINITEKLDYNEISERLKNIKNFKSAKVIDGDKIEKRRV